MAADEAFETIAESWKSTAECKDRWRKILTAYARSIGAYKTQRGRNHVRPYYLAGHLEFLRPHLCKETDVDATKNAEAMSTDMSATSAVSSNGNENGDTSASEIDDQGDRSCFPYCNKNIFRSKKLKLKNQKCLCKLFGCAL